MCLICVFFLFYFIGFFVDFQNRDAMSYLMLIIFIVFFFFIFIQFFVIGIMASKLDVQVIMILSQLVNNNGGMLVYMFSVYGNFVVIEKEMGMNLIKSVNEFFLIIICMLNIVFLISIGKFVIASVYFYLVQGVNKYLVSVEMSFRRIEVSNFVKK